MKVIFIYLPRPYLKQPASQIPLGILYLAAILEQNCIEVDVKNYSSCLTHQAIADLPEADLYGITITSLELLRANRFSHLIKEKYPKAKIGFGGPGTITPEYVDWNVVDFICQGEAEDIIINVVRDVEQGSLKQIYKGMPVSNLDSLPFPAKHLLSDNLGGNVFMRNHNYKQGGSTVLLTARGCPYKCAFCANPWLTEKGGGAVRFRSPQSVRQEITDTIDRYGIRQFRISDDLFTINKKRVIEMCEMMQDLDIIWRISARAKPFSYDIAKIICEAGCKEASFGIESFDNDVLALLKKGITAKENAKALEVARKAGLKARLLLMIGTPGQTAKTVPANIKWLKRVPYEMVACTLFRPMPGSDIWEHPDDYEIKIINKNFDDYNFYFFDSQGECSWKNVIKLKGRTLEEVKEETVRFRAYLKSTGKLNTG